MGAKRDWSQVQRLAPVLLQLKVVTRDSTKSCFDPTRCPHEKCVNCLNCMEGQAVNERRMRA
jgi:hypothetical protein